MSFDEKVYNDVSRNIQNSCFRDGENSLALRMRYLRMALGMSPLWHERIDDQVKDLKVTLDASGEVASYSFTRAPSEAEAIENVRMDYVQKLFRPENGLHPMKDVFSNLVFCCRIAKAVGQMQEYETRVNKLAGQRRKQKRENDDCPLDEIEIGRDRYASRFSFTRMFCWNSLRQSGYLAVVRDGKAARRAFIREIAALAPWLRRLAMLLVFVPAPLVVGASVSLALPVYLDTGAKGLEALAESRRLVEGNLAAVLCVELLPAILGAALVLAFEYAGFSVLSLFAAEAVLFVFSLALLGRLYGALRAQKA